VPIITSLFFWALAGIYNDFLQDYNDYGIFEYAATTRSKDQLKSIKVK